ncbi:MAG TPA: hypothetical protein VH684_04905 [Xanthobacteraceae bacterium]|jgi:hypothetical protein
MSPAGTALRLDAYVAGAADRPSLTAAQNQLGYWLSAASGTKHAIELTWRDGDSLEPPNPSAFASIVSLVGDVARQTSFPDIAALRRLQLGSLVRRSKPVFICTIFRHVPGVPPRLDSAGRMGILERIRRLNLMAAELSQATGANVIDIDSVLAFIGARPLATDYLLSGPVAAAVAGDAIVSALLAGVPDEDLPHVFWQKAHEMHGGIRGIVQRHGRLGRPSISGVPRDAD